MNMQLLRYTLWAFALLCMPLMVSAQCQYRLDMLDSYGDGWNGGNLTVTIGAQAPVTYTLNNVDDDGSFRSVFLTILPGEQVVLNWAAGFFINEVSMALYNADDTQIFQVAAPLDGVIFDAPGVCPACGKPQNVKLDPFDKKVKLKWDAGFGTLSPQSWMVIYDTLGFTPAPGVGDTLIVNTPKATVTGLTPKTKYSFYVRQNCGTTDLSQLTARYDVETYWTNDVGIDSIVTPMSDCNLGIETIRFAMHNFGAAPQSLIPFTFFVNGESGGVPQPEDGYYTGVIGKDSSETIEFETTYDFSDPGEYEITVVTQMTGDEDTSNDTISLYINNYLVVPYAQAFENWNGGFTVSAESSASSWEYGVPNNVIINAAGEGNKAWVTNLDGGYNFFETSYIESTCFDFTDQQIDPAISFLINHDLYQDNDFGFVEVSTDGGSTWSLVGAIDEGINWYNATSFDGDAWTGLSNGWVSARHRLDGVAGESDVRIRFGMRASFFALEGMGIDDIKIEKTLAKDAVGVSVTTDGEDTECGLETDNITFRLANIGEQSIASGYKVSYSINGGTPVTANVTGNLLSPDENETFTFAVPFDSRDGAFTIKCWVTVTGDLNHSNDTITYTVSHLARQTPFVEDFEASTDIPDGWTITLPIFGVTVTDQHNNVSNVLAINMYSGNTTFQYDSPRYGVIQQGDSLRFDYRITQWSEGTLPQVWTGTTNKVEVQISTDCGETYQNIGTINSLNHTPSVVMKARKYSLANFVGKSIRIRFVGTWGSGDFWFDLDNINIIACPGSLQLSAVSVPADEGQNNGSATVNVGIGNAPYKYLWSTGATTQTIEDQPIGPLTVTVTDSHGCSDTLAVNVGNSPTHELAGITTFTARPNPTSGLLSLDIRFDRTVDLQADLVNLLGQTVWTNTTDRTQVLSTQIDLSHQPAGVYFLRVMADGQLLTKRIMKQ